MSWKFIGSWDKVSGVFGFLEKKGIWYLRDAKTIYAISLVKRKIKWKKDLTNDQLFGFSTIYDGHGLILVTAYTSSKDVFLFALDEVNGNEVWNIQIGWNLHNNYGGILTAHEYLYYFDLKDGFRLNCILIKDGKLMANIPSRQIKSSGKFQNKRNTVYLVESNIYALQTNGNLVIYESRNLEIGEHHLLHKDIEMHYVNRKYILAITKKNEIIVWERQGIKLVLSKEMPNNLICKFIHYHEYEGKEILCLATSGKSNLALLDVNANELKLNFEIQNEIIDMHGINNDLIIMLETENSTPIRSLDLSSLKMEELSNNHIVRGGIYSSGTRLFFCTGNGLEIFEKN